MSVRPAPLQGEGVRDSSELKAGGRDAASWVCFLSWPRGPERHLSHGYGAGWGVLTGSPCNITEIQGHTSCEATRPSREDDPPVWGRPPAHDWRSTAGTSKWWERPQRSPSPLGPEPETEALPQQGHGC